MEGWGQGASQRVGDQDRVGCEWVGGKKQWSVAPWTHLGGQPSRGGKRHPKLAPQACTPSLHPAIPSAPCPFTLPDGVAESQGGRLGGLLAEIAVPLQECLGERGEHQPFPPCGSLSRPRFPCCGHAAYIPPGLTPRPDGA